jgi:hypothetical protein
MFLFLSTWQLQAQDLFRFKEDRTTRWASFENPDAQPGQGGKENRGAKGHAYDTVKKGEKVTLMQAKGAGIVNRIWLTVNERSPEALRSLRIQMFWDGAAKPAVDAPLGDFFGIGLGHRLPFENVFFSDPEGRSFNCIIPMPFKTGAQIVLVNEFSKDIQLFYDVNFQSLKKWENDMLYFHAGWNRRVKGEIGEDFEILPAVSGRGRFLGTNIGVQTDSVYDNTWWGEGEVKIYLDRDKEYASLVGTGTEDYIGTAWGQGVYINRYQGSPIADEKKRQWAFYRYHVPDPVFFSSSCRVTIQQMGGGDYTKVRELSEKGVALKPVTVNKDRSVNLLEQNPVPSITSPDFPEGWTNFYRTDDYSATSYFYLDKPTNNLPSLAPVGERVAGVR